MKWLVLLFALLASYSTRAATFNIGNDSGMQWIGITGDIIDGDDDTFVNLTKDRPDLVIFLSSPGGSVNSGLAIADLIYSRHYVTVVPPDTICASVCGAIWLGGEKRFVGENSKVGFHAAFTETRGAIEISPYANAWLGAYFGRIGLSRKTIKYLVEAGPRDMRWLTERDASERGISYTLVPGGHQNSGTESLQSLVMPKADVVVDSQPRPATASVLTQVEADSAARLVRRFNARFNEGGIDAVNYSIKVCYDTALNAPDEKKWSSGVYCAALDVLTTMVGDRLAKATQTSLSPKNRFSAVAARIDNFASQMQFDADTLRARAGLVAVEAANKVDTTQDPQATVQVSAGADILVEHRSSSAQNAPRRQATACSSVATKFGSLSAGLGSFFNKEFCQPPHF